LSYEKDLKVLGKNKLIDPNNPYKIEEIEDFGAQDRILERHPEYRSLSYHTSITGKYKDLTEYIRRFRCKSCHAYKTMKAIRDENNRNLITALICSSCNHLVPLDVKVDINNIGKQTLGLDKRPELRGKSTKLKAPLSESQKLGLDKRGLLDKSLESPRTTLFLEDSTDKKPSNYITMINKHLRRYGFPSVTNPAVKNIDQIEPMDEGFRQFMHGKQLLSSKTTLDLHDALNSIY
jgi:RNase P subunit RPR2